ncbi:hypothetical protein ACVWXO_004234 [Bradyrhizobium sp. LM2.7]
MTSLEKDTFIAVAKEGNYNLSKSWRSKVCLHMTCETCSTIFSCSRETESVWRFPRQTPRHSLTSKSHRVP